MYILVYIDGISNIYVCIPSFVVFLYYSFVCFHLLLRFMTVPRNETVINTYTTHFKNKTIMCVYIYIYIYI